MKIGATPGIDNPDYHGMHKHTLTLSLQSQVKKHIHTQSIANSKP